MDITEYFIILELPNPLMIDLVLNGPAKALSWFHGIYHLQDKLVNSYPYWHQIDGDYGIWFGKRSSFDFPYLTIYKRRWFLGPKKILGQDLGLIMGPLGIDISPTRIGNGWSYYYQGWNEAASSEIIFQDISPGRS